VIFTRSPNRRATNAQPDRQSSLTENLQDAEGDEFAGEIRPDDGHQSTDRIDYFIRLPFLANFHLTLLILEHHLDFGSFGAVRRAGWRDLAVV
jgi:hypothetical protein